MSDDEKVQIVIEAARNVRACTQAANGDVYIIECDVVDALDSALMALDCTCNPAFPYLGDCDVHGLEMPF